jgi:hypothetical protein
MAGKRGVRMLAYMIPTETNKGRHGHSPNGVRSSWVGIALADILDFEGVGFELATDLEWF